MARPLAIDLFCGLGGWTEGLLAEGWDVIGFDIEAHEYGDERYPGQLVIQDVLTLHGSQFRDADLIVASPPCQFFSYTAMPWARAKALAAEVRADPARLEKELALFDACFRIQREACEAAGRRIPLIVENVRGAIPWVGRSRWNFGSFHLWGDVPAIMPPAIQAVKVPSFRFDGSGQSFQTASVRRTAVGKGARVTSRDCDVERLHRVDDDTGVKIGGDWFSDPQSTCRRHGSKSQARKAASAQIAKIPLPLSRHIARVFRPAPTVSSSRRPTLPAAGGGGARLPEQAAPRPRSFSHPCHSGGAYAVAEAKS